MKTSVLLIAQIFALSAEARLRQKTEDLQKKQSDDGGAASTRIINGSPAEEDRYSYAVSLQTRSHFCGGSLIANDMVLSAAHCAGGSYDAIIGRHDHNDFLDGDTVDVFKEYVHPAYMESSNNYDVVVLELARATSANVTPVKLNSSGSTPSDSSPATVIGWGVTESGNTSDELREVEVSIVSQESCKRSYGSNEIKDAMLCAADPGEDSCQGDSGGPLIVTGNSADTDLQVGIVSWGYGCGQPNYPGVYTRVSSAYDWIREKVCDRSKDEDAKRRFQCPSSNTAPTPAVNAETTLFPTPAVVAETTQTGSGAESTISMTGESDSGIDNGAGQWYYEDEDDDSWWWDSWVQEISSFWDNLWG